MGHQEWLDGGVKKIDSLWAGRLKKGKLSKDKYKEFIGLQIWHLVWSGFPTDSIAFCIMLALFWKEAFIEKTLPPLKDLQEIALPKSFQSNVTRMLANRGL